MLPMTKKFDVMPADKDKISKALNIQKIFLLFMNYSLDRIQELENWMFSDFIFLSLMINV